MDPNHTKRAGYALQTARATAVRAFALESSRVLALAVEVVAGVLLVLATSFVVMQVVFRYFLESPLQWTEEAARYTAVWAGLLGASLGVRSSLHFRIVYLIDRFPVKVRQAVLEIGRMVIVLALLVIVWKGIHFVLDIGVVQLSPGMQIRMAWIYSSVPASATIMLAFIACEMVAGEVKAIFTEVNVTERELTEKIVAEAGRAGGVLAAEPPLDTELQK